MVLAVDRQSFLEWERKEAQELSKDEVKQELESLQTIAFGLLTPKERAIFRLRFWKNMTFIEIAYALKIPENEVKNIYDAGLKKLRAFFLSKEQILERLKKLAGFRYESS